MARYAKVVDGVIVKEATATKPPVDPALSGDGGPVWRIIENVTDDQSTGPDKVSESMVQTIEPTRVLRTHVIRDMTAQEIAARKDAEAQSLVDQAQWKAIFVALNEGRTANGKQALTRAQMINWIKDQL